MAQPEPVIRTDIRFDPEKLREVFKATSDLPRKHHAVAVTSKPGSTDPLLEGTAATPEEEMEFSVINDEFRGTYLETVLNALPFRFGRTRLMTIPSQKCYPVHADSSIRYHIALDTHPFTYLLFPTLEKMYHIPEDGTMYRMDARHPHTATNCGPFDRTHLVIISDEP